MAMRKPLVPEEAVRDFVLRQVGGVDKEAERAAREAALAQADEEAGMAMLQRGAAQVGSALSGAKVDEGFFNQLRADADRPLELYEKDRLARATKAKSDRDMQQAASNYALKVLGLKRQEEKDAKDEDYRERRLKADETRAENQARFQQLQLQALHGDKEADRELRLLLAQMAAEDRRAAAEAAARAKQEEKGRLSDKQLETINDFEQSERNVSEVESLLGPNSDWVGPVDGRTPNLMVSGDEVAFRGAVGRMADAYRKAITGAGASAQELAKLESRLPSITDPPETFRAKAKNLAGEIRRNRSIFLNTMRRGGKDVSAFESPPAAPATGGGLSQDEAEELEALRRELGGG